MYKESKERVVAIMRPHALGPMKEALFSLEISGTTISQVNGCGKLAHGGLSFLLMGGLTDIVHLVVCINYSTVAE